MFFLKNQEFVSKNLFPYSENIYILILYVKNARQSNELPDEF